MNDELVELLRNLSSGEFAEVFYKAMGDREERAEGEPVSVGSKLVLAKVGWAEPGSSGPYIEIVCPSLSFGGGRPYIEESGQCERCKSFICSSVKEVYCPICRTFNDGLT